MGKQNQEKYVELRKTETSEGVRGFHPAVGGEYYSNDDDETAVKNF